MNCKKGHSLGFRPYWLESFSHLVQRYERYYIKELFNGFH